jgi:hypothetical protein
MRSLLAALLLVLAPWLAYAQAPEAKPLRILFIGNSLTYTGDVPGRLAMLARAMGRKAEVDSITAPGYTLEDHWREGKAQEAIRKGWDVVVLQQGSSARYPDRTLLIDYARRFARPSARREPRPALYMVWPTRTACRISAVSFRLSRGRAGDRCDRAAGGRGVAARALGGQAPAPLRRP